MSELLDKLAVAVQALPPEAVPYFAEGCVQAAIMAHRDAATLPADARRSIRSLAIEAMEAFGKA
jgi:hypothetical protein